MTWSRSKGKDAPWRCLPLSSQDNGEPGCTTDGIAKHSRSRAQSVEYASQKSSERHTTRLLQKRDKHGCSLFLLSEVPSSCESHASIIESRFYGGSCTLGWHADIELRTYSWTFAEEEKLIVHSCFSVGFALLLQAVFIASICTSKSILLAPSRHSLEVKTDGSMHERVHRAQGSGMGDQPLEACRGALATCTSELVIPPPEGIVN